MFCLLHTSAKNDNVAPVRPLCANGYKMTLDTLEKPTIDASASLVHIMQCDKP